MRPSKNDLILRRTTKFFRADLNSSSVFTDNNEYSDSIGGIIRKGQLGWLARGPLLEVFSLRNGNKISSYRFDITTSFKRCFITCVSEIEATNLSYCLLAVGLQFGEDSGGMVAIYSVQESKILRSIETADRVTCSYMISSNLAERTILQLFQGCLAIGTDTGKIILLDLNLRKCEKILNAVRTSDDNLFLVPCHVVLWNMDADHIAQHFRHSQQENVGFGIQLEVFNAPELVLSLLLMEPLLSLAAGLEDGRMILYDLRDLHALHIAYPPEDLSPLAKLAYVEPPDDPRACVYIWAFHENRHSAIAVMHSVMYDRKTIDDDDDDGFYVYEGFQACSVRLTLPMFERESIPVSCQSVIKATSPENEETISLCLLAWKSRKTSEILIFDVNQWYKEQMPHMGDWRDNLSYLASFPLKESNLLDVWLDNRTIAPFNSIHRPEEHFFPISLSFDCIILRESENIKFHWPGLQNRALGMLNMAGPSALLEPSVYYHEITKASLVPQNSPDYCVSSSVLLSVQREVLLTVALEYNCFGLLKESAKCWADGSHLGRKPEESLSLSTMTTWIWKRAENVKDRCNSICVPLFDHSGLRIDQRSQVELSYYSRQLKLLAELMKIILTKCNEYIPEDITSSLKTQYNSIKMASEYQEVLQWFLNVGLLPEARTSRKGSSSYLENSYDSRPPLVPYPYKALRNFYMSQRMKFKKINSGLLSPRTQSCRILYIDSFIEHECNSSVLREHWLESGGNGLYPPPSLQAMLRVLLVPDVSIECKYALFIYFFLDLNMVLEDESAKYIEVIQNFMKFPSVFKISSSAIKIIQAFWNLDHGQFKIALDEIVSPFLHDHKLTQWQKELLIEALLVHQASKLALRALQAPGPPISSLLELKTLLANDMVAEAFHLQRSKSDPDLFRQFLTGCLYLGKMCALLDLALTEDEDKILEEFLRESKTAKTENLHFVHLLQRSKYIEAIQQLDELSRSKVSQHSVDLETPSLVLAAYNTTMTPATKRLSEVYYGIRNRLRANAPEAQKLDTLSSQLLRYNANDVLDGVYHSSIMSVDEATNYWDADLQRERKRLLYPGNVAFIRRPQLEAFTGYQGEGTISYPEVYRGAPKRRLNISDESNKEVGEELNMNPKKRQKINDSLSGTKTAEPMNASLLTRFKSRQKNKSPGTEQTIVSNSSQSRYDKDSSINCLNTPIVKSSQRVIESRDDSMSDTSEFGKLDRIGTPQSILKVRNASTVVSSPLKKTTESTPRRSVSPRELVSNEYIDEEKSIRFDLPSTNISSNSLLQTSQESLDMSQRVPSTSMASTNVEGKNIATKLKKRLTGPSARKTLRPSDVSLISASSNEEFFSPVQSRNNSMQKKSTDDKNQESESDDEANITQIVRHFEEQQENEYEEPWVRQGPKARKPLHRASRSRSKTPDIPSSPVRMSSRLLERSKAKVTSVYQTESSTKITKQISSKSLGRFLLESNAKKASSLIPLQSSDDMFEKGKVLAQSTEISESYVYSSETTTADMSTLPATSYGNLMIHPSAFSSLKETFRNDEKTEIVERDVFKNVVDKSEMMKEAEADDLLTTAEITRSDVSTDEASPPKGEDSKGLSRIGGRRSYKTTNEIARKSFPTILKQNLDFLATQLDLHRKAKAADGIAKDVDVVETFDAESKHSNESKEQEDVLAIIEDMEYEVSKVYEDLAEKVEIKKTFEEQVETEEEAECLQNESDDDIEEIAIENYGVENNESDDESSSNDDESKSSAIISISSGDDSSQASTLTTTSNGAFTNSPIRKDKEMSDDTRSEQDDEQLLYGDLDVSSMPMRSQSISSAETEVFTAPSVSDIEMLGTDERDEVETHTNKYDNLTTQQPTPSASDIEMVATDRRNEVETNTYKYNNVTSEQESVHSTARFGNSLVELPELSITNVVHSDMSLNVLTGEYEKVEENDTVENITGQSVASGSSKITQMEVVEAKDIIETNIGDLKALESGKTNQDIVLAFESPKQDIIDTSGNDKSEKNPSHDGVDRSKNNVENDTMTNIAEQTVTEKQEESMPVKDVVTSEATSSEKVTNETVNQVQCESMSTDGEAVDEINERQSETSLEKKKPSTSPFRSRTQTPEITDDIRLKISDDETDKVGDENQLDDKQNANTPVKTSFEIDSTTNSGRTLRSARHPSTSIEATITETNTVVESPSVVKKVLRAASLPREGPADTPTKSKLRRRSNSTDNPSTPIRVLTRRRSTLLDRIEENTILDSPRRSTTKSASAESGSNEVLKTPTSMVKRSRKTSTSSVDTPETVVGSRRRGVLSEENTQTPQRMTRRSSVSKDTPKASPKVEVKEKPLKVQSKNTSTPLAENMSVSVVGSDESEILEGKAEDMAKVQKSGGRKLFTKGTVSKETSVEKSDTETSPEKEENMPYTTSRRLTRNQQSVLEKSASIAKKLESIPKKIPRRRGSKIDESPSKRDDISETESIISTQSKQSVTSTENRRITRSSAIQKADDDDIVSVASSSRSRRSTTENKKSKSIPSKDKNLDAIVEEDQENKMQIDSVDESDEDMAPTHSSKEIGKKKGRGKKSEK